MDRVTCEHEDFAANVEVSRITDVDGGLVVGYYADLRISCAACGEPMVFRGMPIGLGQDRPPADPAEVGRPPHGIGTRRVLGPRPRGHAGERELMAPHWEYRYVDRYDDGGAELLAALLADEWEPFAAEHNPGGVSRIHLRRPIRETPAAGG